MATDERLKWLEVRIASSLKPRNEDLKTMLTNDDNRLACYEFVNNEDVKRLFVFMRPGRLITASLQPPIELQTKSIFFLKCQSGTKLTKDNMDTEVFYIDGTRVPLEHLELTIREVFLPLLATNTHTLASAPGNGDKIMDILHRLMAAVEVSQGHVEGRITLHLPAIEVLAEAAASPSRRAAVLHVLETTVIGWIKQIRAVQRHDPQADLAQQFGEEPGPLDEISMWKKHLDKLLSIDDQLDSEVAKDILQNLESANSQYGHSFGSVRKDIAKAQSETRRILKFLSTLEPWYLKLHSEKNPKKIIKLFKPLMHVLNLVWAHSTYYHQIDKFHHLLRLLSNEIVHRAIAMVGDDVLREPLESYSKLKDALRFCAAFRGTYLDFKEKADDQNAKNIAENAEKLAARPRGNLFKTKMYGPHAYTPRYGLRHVDSGNSVDSADEEELWMDSPWPARNAPCFDLLNNFMERCNDVLELVETTRHFRLLAGAADIGGAGSPSLDSMVKELHSKYTFAMKDFFGQVKNVLSIDGNQQFERAFFNFRTTVKDLEKSLAGILNLAFDQCPLVEAQLRLLEVFEGISGRELVQQHLKDKDKTLVTNFTSELKEVKDIFAENYISPPLHRNMPYTVSKLMWVQGLKDRIRTPMEKMKQVSPHSLEGDSGWQMRDLYTDIIRDLDKYESDVISQWQVDIMADLTQKLKEPLLIAEEYDEDIDVRPRVIHVNLDPKLLLLFKEIHYLSQPPFSIHLSESAKELLRSTNYQHLSVTATRLETIVSKYNTIMRTITTFEKPMFERKLAQIDNLLEQGLQQLTWKMKESVDFIEMAMSIVCLDVHQNLDIVQTNCNEIAEMTTSWSRGELDVFSARDETRSYSMDELLALHKKLNDDLETAVSPASSRIHSLVNESYEVVQISQASPAWRDYIDYIDAIVLDGLKQATVASLRNMLNTLVQANMIEDMPESKVLPILTIRAELIESNIDFRPPLDQSTSVVSVQELVQTWLQSYLDRGKLVKMLGPKGSYAEYITLDDEVKDLLTDIQKLVMDNSEECKKLLEVFKEYSFLWLQDVNRSFEDFLDGVLRPNPIRMRSAQKAKAEKSELHQGSKFDKNSQASRTSSAKSLISAQVLETAERNFLMPKVQEGKKSNVPSLDEFDQEIDIYRITCDELTHLEDYHTVGWIRVDLQPVKQVLTTYAAKWMWTFTQYLSDQVTSMLEKLDVFLKRIEPEIEQITGEERDTASFMKMMRLFNEVSAQQNEMDGKFAAMHRTVLLLQKYDQVLPEKTYVLFSGAPARWNNLKTKVSLAKQRLGPRIQEESASITQDLKAFAVHVANLSEDLENSECYQRECSSADAHATIDKFSKKLLVLENEAQDLIELQELLETSVVNFSLLPRYRHELDNLKQVWDTARDIEEKQTDWKQQRWQRINTKHLREETNKQLDIVRALPEDVFTWDVYMGLHESITTIQACLPLIDDLSNPAMRTRHWKQLVRVTGGAFTIDNDSLKRMTFRELLSLGLQQHVDDVRAIVLRAVKDLAIESALKTYEEVWLSKIFELRNHIHVKVGPFAEVAQDNQSENSQGDTTPNLAVTGAMTKSARATSRTSNQSSHSKNKRGSISSLPASLFNLGEDPGTLKLLTNTEPIFEELEHHQITLQAMQSNSAAGSFLDEVLKWQKTLQTIEAVLQIWLDVQDKWVEMEEVYLSSDVRQALPHDANKFALVNKDLRLLMRATERNPNVMQCCNRKNILPILEHMSQSLEVCRKSLLHHLEKRRQIFPRFFFLSMEDVLRIICNGYDLSMVNMYISKLLENVARLVYEEADENEKFNFIVTGLQSALGEQLHFNQVVNCEGQIENWLSNVLHQIRATLQAHLTHVLGIEKITKPRSRHIHSAGARKVSLAIEENNDNDDTEKENLMPSKKTTQNGNLGESRGSSETGKERSKSWTLDNVTEIIHLATNVQMSGQISAALEDFKRGNKEALTVCLKNIEASIESTVQLLKGLDHRMEESMTAVGKEKNNHIDLIKSGKREKTPVRKEGEDNSGQDGGGEKSNAESEVGPNLGEEEHTASTLAPLDPMAPLDSMSLIVSPPGEKGIVGSTDATEETQEKPLTLFPSQFHKLTSLLSLFAHLRDLIQRLIAVSRKSSPIESFDWKSQLVYEHNQEEKVTSVKCMKARFEYGFEYLGSSNREVISPLTEKVFLMIAQALQAHIGILAMGPREGIKFELIHEMSKCLGQPLYMFNCALTTDYTQLQDIFRGLAATGSWVCFNEISLLMPSCMSLLAQLMSAVMEALQAGKAAVHLLNDDVQLSPHGACFALMDSAVQVTPRNSDNLLIYPSAAAQLPDEILKQFRVISLTKPDLLLSLEVLLFSQGFVYGRELAWKITQLYETCRDMFGTNTFVSNHIFLGTSRSASFYGWSIQSLKGVVTQAGALMDKLQAENKETVISSIIENDQRIDDKVETHPENLVISTKKMRQEEDALTMALRDTFMPRMTSRDASVFATILNDLWPNVEMPMIFGGEEEPEIDKDDKNETSQVPKADDRIKSSKSLDSQKSLRDSLQLNTPVISLDHEDKFSPVLNTEAKQALEDIKDAISVATADLGLLPGTAFQARALQLAHLNAAHQSILVVGPSGCGKSECIKTFAVAERERGKTINVQSVFIKAVESGELLGHFDDKKREWHDGLLTALLRKFCVTPPTSANSCKPMMKIMQLDGECDSYQMELLHSVLNHTGSVVLPNNERLSIPDTLTFIWELESLENMSPSLLATVGVLVMSATDVGWKLMLVQWLDHRNEPDKDLLTELCNIYIETVVDYVTKCTQPAMFGSSQKQRCKTPQFKRVISHSFVNMVRTFTNLLEALIKPFNDLTDVEYERYFNFAAVWAFGGTLAEEHREEFSNWWKEQFENHIDYPTDGTVFDYIVDNETHEFFKWGDLVPSYTGTPHKGIPHDAFVHTVHTEQLLHLMGLLTDAGKPVMLVGESGCSKTAIINERIRTVCSGEVAEVLSLSVYANRFTNARLLFDRIDERLEWKHGRTFVPRGNKRLLCLIDDINLSQTDQYGFQTACELIREQLDDGGFYSPTNHAWRYVKSVTYVTSVNPRPTADVPPVSQRLLRHFAVFGCPYPGVNELQSIFSTLLSTHFFTPESSAAAVPHAGLHDDKVQGGVRFEEESLKKVINSIVKVTVELSERMRSMFLPTSQRCHYIFSTRDLGTIFRNICLSLQPGCNKRNLLLLWQHECFWVYGKRMVSEVDFRRFRQAFVTAVRKQFIDDDQIQSIIKPHPPLFSNLIEQDSGLVTAGMIDARSSANVSEEDAKTDLYRPAKSHSAVKELLERGVEEYNKIHPRIKLALYKSVIEQVCRVARILASPHEGANSVLVAEGCPGRCSIIVRLAANLSGFSIFQISFPNSSLSTGQKMDLFKSDLVHGYTRAGIKGEKVLLLLREEEIADTDYLVFLTEFIVSGAITHLFTQEEQTTIINSIRTEVTQAGLTYTREVAWNFFLRTVRNNFRMILIACGGVEEFQHMCREYPSFTKNVNFLWFPHWSKTQLIENAMFHLKSVSWMTDVHKENVAHMLASMHLVLRQQDGGEKTRGEYGHVNNTSYEKFVERFISLANERNSEVKSTQEAVTSTLKQIRHENEVAIKLKKQLEHELIVLEERKAGTIKILSQIGQDTAITEQQVKVVKNQMEKITRLKKRLPEYQVAHERAVYKAIAIVADTKRVVKLMDVNELAELRALQKPSLELEDLMSTIIMLLKSPSADLTWQKGAKRQMANLERFIEELITFDDFQLPESTLALVEPTLKKPSFDSEIMAQKTGNSACGALCKWVRGVVGYHRMMLSKVKPLHQKVEETTQAVDTAQHKMNTLENKRKALELRLADLARAFEEATIDKNEQEDKTIRMKKMLDTAAQLRRILSGERQRSQQIFDSYERRMLAIPGGCAMAAAFATYLGSYHHSFRRVMLTIHWPGCLRERGIPLVIDSVDGLRGRVIDWSIGVLKTASGASSVYDMDYTSLLQHIQGSDSYRQDPADGENAEQSNVVENVDGEIVREGDGDKVRKGSSEGRGHERNQSGMRPISKSGGGEKKLKNGEMEDEDEKKDQEKEGIKSPDEKSPPSKNKDIASPPENDVSWQEVQRLTNLQDLDMEDEDLKSDLTSGSGPMLTTVQYNRYVRSLVKLLIGDSILNEWLMKDFGPQQIENSAILCSSWQRPPMMIDPNNEGAYWLGYLNKVINKGKLITLDMEHRSEAYFVASLEKAITKGRPVLLKNCAETIDNMIMPLVHHRNTAIEKNIEDEPRMILFCGRRILCHPNFRCYLSTPLSRPRFNPVTASNVTLINFGVSHDTLMEDLLARVFARIRPELFVERNRALKNLQLQKDTLYKFSETVKDQVLAGGQEAMLSSTKALQFITNITEAKLQLAQQLSGTQETLDDLDLLRDELYPVARRASLMFSLTRSLAAICTEYNFTIKYFMELFDEAVGGEFPAEFFKEVEPDESDEEDSTDGKEKRKRLGSVASQASNTERQTGDKQDNQAVNDYEGKGSGKLAPAETEDSASTGAVQKLVHGSDSDELPAIEMPNTVPLPTEGVSYTSYTSDKVKHLMDSVTSLVYHRVNVCLFEEDRLLFSTLLCLSMKVESGEDITNEEMSLFLQGNPGLGMQLTLSDFDCKADPPAWLPKEKWEDILALSVLPGPLDSLCVDFAINSDAWKSWYLSTCPEQEKLPIGTEKKDEEDGKEKEDKGTEKHLKNNLTSSNSPPSGLNEFHQLLILRMLRPDRLPTALLDYTRRHLTAYDPEEEVFNVKEVLVDAKKHWGVLVLLPPSASDPNGHPASRLKLTDSPADQLSRLAKVANISVHRAVVSDCSAVVIEEALEKADKEDGWAIIESVHLATPSLRKQLIHHLQRIYKSRENGDDKSKFCVWLASQTNSSLPLVLIENLLKVAWNSILSYPDLSAEKNADDKWTRVFNPLCPRSYLKTAITSSLRLIPDSLLTSLSEASQLIKNLAFAVGVIQGVLMSRQLFGSVGLARWYPFAVTQMTNAIQLLTSESLRSGDRLEPSLEDLCYAVPELIYCAMISEDHDKEYVSSLCKHIITSVYHSPQSAIHLGAVSVPVPPNSVDPREMADWFEHTADDNMTLAALQLNTAIEKSTNDASSAKFVSRLDRMFETQNMDAGAVSVVSSYSKVNLNKLRSALDICLERLPLLLELGEVPQLMKAEYDFPYHCPSIISMSSAGSRQMPESIGYVLLQECLWMNTILCHIRQEIHNLDTNLLGGSGALPRRLLHTVYSLQEEFVPVSWIHPNCQPCTHSLLSWLDDLRRRHNQLNLWVRRSMVPTFVDGQVTENSTISRGQLTTVWLGGLVNPQALLTAMRQEKAILAKVSLEDVFFECVVLSQIDQDDFDMEEGGLFISDVVLENAAWNYQENKLEEAKDSALTFIKCLYLKPAIKTSRDGATGISNSHQLEDNSSSVSLPVYINKSRQMQIWSLPVRCSQTEKTWTLSRAAFLLDPGLLEGGSKKSRAFLMLQRLPPMMHAGQEEAESGEEEEEGEKDKGEEHEEEEEAVFEDSGESSRSQMSYKPMSPQAPPLPEGLGLKREPPIFQDEAQEKVEEITVDRRDEGVGQRREEIGEEEYEKTSQEKDVTQPKNPGIGNSAAAEKREEESIEEVGEESEEVESEIEDDAVYEDDEEEDEDDDDEEEEVDLERDN